MVYLRTRLYALTDRWLKVLPPWSEVRFSLRRPKNLGFRVRADWNDLYLEDYDSRARVVVAHRYSKPYLVILRRVPHGLFPLLSAGPSVQAQSDVINTLRHGLWTSLVWKQNLYPPIVQAGPESTRPLSDTERVLLEWQVLRMLYLSTPGGRDGGSLKDAWGNGMDLTPRFSREDLPEDIQRRLVCRVLLERARTGGPEIVMVPVRDIGMGSPNVGIHDLGEPGHQWGSLLQFHGILPSDRLAHGGGMEGLLFPDGLPEYINFGDHS